MKEREKGRKGEREKERKKKITSHRELDVYKLAFDAAMKIFQLTKTFPVDERFSLTSQIRRASRSVCGNVAEACRKRRYEAAFVSKLCDCEGEAAEVQTWLAFSVKCEYMERSEAKALYSTYDQIIGKLVRMINSPEPWLLHGPRK